MSMSSPPGGGGGAFGGPPGGFGGPPGGGPGGFGGPPGDAPPGGAFGGPPGGAPPGGGYGPPPGGAPPGGAFGGPPPGGFGGPPGDAPPGGAFGGPPPGGFGGPPGGGPPPGGFGGPPGDAPPGGAFGGPPPGGFGGPPGGGPPPGGFGGPPGDPGGYGPPPGGAFGGPPPGGAFGGPPGGGYGPPPGGFGGPPMGQPPGAKKGPPVGLIVGLGCGGLFLIGIIISVVFFFSAKKAAEEIASTVPDLKTPSGGSGSGSGSKADTGSLKAELRDLREWKAKLGDTRYFVGEIHNTGSGNIGFPMAKVTFYDAANTAVESGTCMSVARVLPPGEKVPCNFLVTGKKTWTTHKVEIKPQRAFFTGQLAKLDIADVKFTPKKRVYGAHEIDGKITNKSSFTAKNVMAIVSLYDKSGKIVGSTQVPVAGNNLATGTSAKFEAKIFDTADTPDKWQVLAVGYSE